MFTARFKVLGITIPIGLKVYHDDGYVTSIPNHMQKLAKTYSGALDPGMEEFVGMCISFRGVLRTHLHIFYKDSNDEI